MYTFSNRDTAALEATKLDTNKGLKLLHYSLDCGYANDKCDLCCPLLGAASRLGGSRVFSLMCVFHCFVDSIKTSFL